MRRLRAFLLDELLLAQAVPGFVLCAGWAVMYEIYHEDGSYYTTLMQEILGGDGLYTDFLISAVLMAFPVGLVIDAVREVLRGALARHPAGARGPPDDVAPPANVAAGPPALRRPRDTVRPVSARPGDPLDAGEDVWKPGGRRSWCFWSGSWSRSSACRGGMSFPWPSSSGHPSSGWASSSPCTSGTRPDWSSSSDSPRPSRPVSGRTRPRRRRSRRHPPTTASPDREVATPSPVADRGSYPLDRRQPRS